MSTLASTFDEKKLRQQMMQAAGVTPDAPLVAVHSNGSINTIINMGTRAEAELLAATVSRVISGVVNIFGAIAKDAAAPDALLSDIATTCDLCGRLPPLCLDKESALAASGHVERLKAAREAAAAVFAKHGRRAAPLDKAAASGLAREFKTLLDGIVALTELMDRQQVQRLLMVCKQAFEQVLYLRQSAGSDFRITQRLESAEADLTQLARGVGERVPLIEAGDKRTALADAHRQLVDGTPALLRTTREVAERQPGAADRHTAALGQVARALQVILQVVQESAVVGKADYSLKLSELLDELQAAVRDGSVADATGVARKLANNINDLEGALDKNADEAAQRALAESIARLKAMTGKLLGATKSALESKDGPGQDQMAALMDDIKRESQLVDRRLLEGPTSTMKESGLMEAAVLAAQQLSDMFVE